MRSPNLSRLRFGNLGVIPPLRGIASGLCLRNGVGPVEPAVKINLGAALGAERAGRERGRLSAYWAGTKWLLGLPFAGADAISGGGHVFRDTWVREGG